MSRERPTSDVPPGATCLVCDRSVTTESIFWHGYYRDDYPPTYVCSFKCLQFEQAGGIQLQHEFDEHCAAKRRVLIR